MARTGRAKTPEGEAERRRKISEARKGMRFTAEHKSNIADAQRRRPPASDEARAKMSAAQKGRTITWGAKISATKTGVPVPALRGPRPGAWIDGPKYRAAHARVQARRGRASDYLCVDCSQAAAHWSFSWRRVPPEKWMWEGRPYTSAVEDYDPRCMVCARRYDSEGYGAHDKMVRQPFLETDVHAK